jgi:KDO2-lipid IV(A) lauroyltransferase
MNVREGLSRDIMRLVVWYPLRWLVAALPPASGIKVLRAMGDVHYALGRGRARPLSANLGRLRRAAPGASAVTDRDAIREYMRNHYIDRLLIFVFPRFGVREVNALIGITGIEHLDRALKNGKGAVLVHGHLGPVHLPLVALSRLGYRMKQIGMPSDEGLSWIGRNVAFRLRLRYESMMPAEVIRADGFLRGAFRWLGDNGVIMITGDGSGAAKRVGRHEVFRFFGQDVSFPLGPAMLAEKTGAALLPLFITPGDEGRLYRIVIEGPLRTEGVSAAEATAAFVERLQDHVSRNPGYMHFLDRFHPGGIIEKDAGH